MALQRHEWCHTADAPHGRSKSRPGLPGVGDLWEHLQERRPERASFQCVLHQQWNSGRLGERPAGCQRIQALHHVPFDATKQLNILANAHTGWMGILRDAVQRHWLQLGRERVGVDWIPLYRSARAWKRRSAVRRVSERQKYGDRLLGRRALRMATSGI